MVAEEDHLVRTPDYIATLNRHLPTLSALIQSPEAVNGDLSEDDIRLFAALRTLSIVRGVVYPPRGLPYKDGGTHSDRSP